MPKQLVLSVKAYDFENSKGEKVVGAKVTYINKKPSSRDTEIGYPPLIVSVANMDLVKRLDVVPGIYDLEFEQVTGKNNRPEIILSDIEYLSPADLSLLFE